MCYLDDEKPQLHVIGTANGISIRKLSMGTPYQSHWETSDFYSEMSSRQIDTICRRVLNVCPISCVQAIETTRMNLNWQ